MRLTIASKLFIGFLIVIALNTLFFVVVNKTSNVNEIVNILKTQNEIKNDLLRLKTQHRVRGPSVISFEHIGRQESVENFRQSNYNVVLLLDSITQVINTIAAQDSVFSVQERYKRNRQAISDIQQKLTEININNSTYVAFFEDLVLLRDTPDTSETQNHDSTWISLKNNLNHADVQISKNLDSTLSLIDGQTVQRIKDISDDVTNIKKLTVFIVCGISLFAIFFAFIFSRTIANSLRRLKESALKIAKSNFEVSFAGFPNDETGDLAVTLHEMAVDLKNTQEELIKSRRLAAIGEVVASVNHEINNPLMIISGNAQFLEMTMEDFPEEMKDRVRTIIEETERISRVTRKLREIRNPVTEDYTSTGEQMINIDKSSI